MKGSARKNSRGRFGPPLVGPRLQREGLCKFRSCQPSSLCCRCLTIALLQPREEHGQQSVRQSVSEAPDPGARRLREDRGEQGDISHHTGRLREAGFSREERKEGSREQLFSSANKHAAAGRKPVIHR